MNDAPEIHARPKIVGARIKRTEDPRLLTGRGVYTDDRPAPQALHVAFCRSEQAHSRLRAIDAAAARAAPGVVAVLAAGDLGDAVKPLSATSRMANYHATPILPLARGKVRYVGEPVVGVLAASRYEAEDAAALVAVDYEPLPHLVNAEEAARPGAPLLHEAAGTNVIVSREFKRGDAEAASAAAPMRVGGRFRMRRKTPMAIEPRAYLAEYDGGRDALTLHSATQVPGIVRDALATALDMPPERLRVIAPDVGGGFGGKGSLYPEEIFVCAAARKLKRAVKWTGDRREDLIANSQGFDEIVDAELALDDDGRILALRADAIGDVGAYSIYPWTAALEPVQVVSFLPGPYRVQNYHGRVQAVATAKAPTGPYRGVGRPISTFVMERLMDMAAHKLGIGIACYAELTGIGSRISVAPGMPINTGTETAIVRIEPSGAVTATLGIASHGQGLETTLAQIVAEHLGARFADIRVRQGDSAGVAGTGTYASRSLVLAGGAATLAARAVREKLLNAASHLLETAVT